MTSQAKMISVLFTLALIGVMSSAFVVKEYEYALKFQFKKVIDDDYSPGLHWRIPFIQDIKRFDKRIQTLDTRPQRFLTSEKKDVIVDSYVKWRISDVSRFYLSTNGDFTRTSDLLAERINTSLRNEFGKRTIQEVISGDRKEVMLLLTKDADTKAAELGVEVLDVRVKQINLPDEVSDSVYERMRAERDRVARDFRAKGAEQAEKIRAEADRQQVIIRAEAFKKAEILRGEGDSVSAKVYADSFNQNKEFYDFYRSMTAYRKVFSSGNDVMVLKPDSEFFKYFGSE